MIYRRMLSVAVAVLAATISSSSLLESQTASAPLAATAPTAVPALVPYSGSVSELAGKPREYSATFLIYKDREGGEPLWSETQTVAVDAKGLFSTHLGAATPSGLPSEVFSTGEARWLEVQIAGELAQPRVLLASVPYALKAADAATLGGLPASAYALAGSLNPPAGDITPGVHPLASGPVNTAGGTVNSLAKFNSATTLANSIISDTGTAVGIGTTTPAAALDVNGATYLRGDLTELAAGKATASGGFSSRRFVLQAQAFNSSTASAVTPSFQWRAEPTGNNTANPGATLNLMYAPVSTAAETGLSINPNGTINFASGQTFPGTGGGSITGVTAGTGLTGGGSAGAVTLNVDPTKVPSLAGTNTFLGNQTVLGNLGISGTLSIAGVPMLSNSPPGSGNAFVGGAGNATTQAEEDTATGVGALGFSASGVGNTADGAYAMWLVTAGNYDTAVGYSALAFTGGSDNTAVGASSGPPSGALTNTTALGANAVVSQNNSLVLGNTVAATPGAEFVNVGIGTATPVSVLEASVAATGKLGPTLTLTNPAGETNAAASIDFNSYQPKTTGTYNPTARIVAVDDGNFSNNLYFMSNTLGKANNGLQTNMVIASSGNVGIGPIQSLFGSKLTVQGVGSEISGTAISAYGGLSANGQGWDGMDATGASTEATGPSAVAGEGGEFYGGNYEGPPGGGYAGDGISVRAGTGGISLKGVPGSYAGYFLGELGVQGDAYIYGTMNAESKDFMIDHPADPANKFLRHNSVESSEMMNIYTGNVTTNDKGEATVDLPSWFESLNRDFRYQLTTIGRRAQAWVAAEVADGKFSIATDSPNVKVSWQITGVRQDAYAKAHPLVVEEDKDPRERGFYMHPEFYGAPAEKQLQWATRPDRMRRLMAGGHPRQLAAETATPVKAVGVVASAPASAVGRNFYHQHMNAPRAQQAKTPAKK